MMSDVCFTIICEIHYINFGDSFVEEFGSLL